MADKKISELDALAGANTADDDRLVIVDTSAGLTKSITMAEFKNAFDSGSGFVRVTGDTMTGDLGFGDNDKAIFGAGSDLAVFSNGTDSFIQEYTTGGHLYIDGTNILMRNRSDGSLRLQTSDSGAVDLYHSGSSKLATTSTGVNVNGKATLTSGELAFSGSISDPNGAAYIWRPADNTLAFGTANEERLRINSSGRVGIGTSSVAFPLDVSTNSSTTNDAVVVARLSANTTGTAANNFGAALNFSGEDASGSLRDLATINGIYTNATNRSSALTFKTRENLGALTTQMTIASSGSVGIGTASPTDYDGEADNLVVASSGHTGITIASTGSNQRTNLYFSDGTVGSAAYRGGFSYDHNDDSLLVRTAGAEAMRIDSSGNVSIGSTEDNPFNWSGSSNNVSITASGANDFAQLSLKGNGTGGTGINLGAGSVRQAGIFSLSGSSLAFATNATNSGTSITTRMTIDSSGNLLVGQTTANSFNLTSGFGFDVRQTYGLGVAVQDNPTAIFNRTNTDGDIMQFRKNGSTVGSIGVSGGNNLYISGQASNHSGITFGTDVLMPTRQGATTDNITDLGASGNRFKDLHLSGTIEIENGTGNVGVGKQALNSLTSGDRNIAIGVDALESHTTGSINTAVGNAAMYANTTGEYNVAIGGSALSSNTTANNNTAVGYQAGYTNSTGAELTAVGRQAAYSLTTGSENTALGSIALYSTTTGSFNVAVGRQALQSNTTASHNTAVGFQAAYSTTTGTINTALGLQTLYDNTTGSYNVAVGGHALENNSTAVRNTAVGYQAGYSTATGSYNVLIGDEAGKDLTVYSSTFVGSAAGENVTSGYGNSLFGRKAANKLTSGITNVIMGYYAGDDLTTGSNNTAVGAYAGDALTTGYSNVAVGYQSLSLDTKGARNVAIGQFALAAQNFTTATNSYNVGVGFQAGSGLTTGVENTLIGGLSGDALTVGYQNVALGYQALGAGQGSSANVAVGVGALMVANSGTTASATYNTGVGHLAGTAVTTGVGNQLFGSFSGDQITTGQYNVCLGYDVGSSIQNLSTGNKNILIGYKTSGPTTTDNAIGIGDSVTVAANDFSFGKASNIVTNDFDADANWSRSSDERLKKNITNQTLGLDFINDLRTVKYNWKPSDELDANDAQLAHLRREDEDGNIINDMNTDVVMHNFIAQEVKAALDAAGVSEFGGWKEDQFGVQQVSREMFVIPLVKAVQELSAKNDALEARITALEGA